MKNIILSMLLVLVFSQSAFCFDAEGFFTGKTVWTNKESGATTVKNLFVDRFDLFKTEMASTDLFGFTSQVATAATIGVGSPVFSVSGGSLGTHSIDLSEWPAEIFDTCKGIFMVMALLMFIRILFKGGVA